MILSKRQPYKMSGASCDPSNVLRRSCWATFCRAGSAKQLMQDAQVMPRTFEVSQGTMLPIVSTILSGHQLLEYATRAG